MGLDGKAPPPPSEWLIDASGDKPQEGEEEELGDTSPDQKQGQKPSDQQSQGQAQGQKPGRPGTPPQPTSPMQRSTLVPGAVKRPSRLSELHEGRESGDWARLPPRQREKIRQIMRKRMSERYRQIIKDYMSRLAEQETP